MCVENVGDSSFYKSYIEDIEFDIHSKLKTIGENAFYGCKQLTMIKIQSSVENIEYKCFEESSRVPYAPKFHY